VEAGFTNSVKFANLMDLLVTDFLKFDTIYPKFNNIHIKFNTVHLKFGIKIRFSHARVFSPCRFFKPQWKRTVHVMPFSIRSINRTNSCHNGVRFSICLTDWSVMSFGFND
jgi:hypothetical protein